MSGSEADYYADLEKADLLPLWRIITQTREPTTVVQPHLWRWREVYPMLLRSGDIMKPAAVQRERTAERRVLLFINPGLKQQRATTNTLVAALQLIFPGELAPAHRHSPTAIRFILHGRGAYTTIDGEKLTLEPGDLAITPNGAWHDHGNESDEPVVWFDGLDRLLVQHLDTVFSDPHPSGKQDLTKPVDHCTQEYGPTTVRPVWEHPCISTTFSPQLCYRWQQTSAELRRLAERGEAGPFDEVAVAYVNPRTNGHACPTLGCTAQLLTPGSHTKARRNTGSAIYTVKDGRGVAVIDGVRLAWEKGDLFIVPPWAWYELSNKSESEEAFLFCLNDHPTFQALGFFQEQAYRENGGHQVVTGELSAVSATSGG